MDKHLIKSKIALNARLTPFERSAYLLYIASDKEAKDFLQAEKAADKIDNQRRIVYNGYCKF